MWLSYLEDVQFNHGSIPGWLEISTFMLFCMLSVSQQMSHCSFPCKHCVVGGKANTEIQKGARSQGYRPSVIDLHTIGVQPLQKLSKGFKLLKKRATKDILTIIDCCTATTNNLCFNRTLLSKMRHGECQMTSVWSTMKKSISNTTTISLMLMQTTTRKYEEPMASWEREMFEVPLYCYETSTLLQSAFCFSVKSGKKPRLPSSLKGNCDETSLPCSNLLFSLPTFSLYCFLFS